MNLLLSHAEKVRAEIGIITLDEDAARTFEPSAATPKVRLDQMATLVAGGVATEARLDPILPGLTDTPDALRGLFSALANVGVKRAAASTLFLRPSISASLKRSIPNQKTLEGRAQPVFELRSPLSEYAPYKERPLCAPAEC
jgi:DNA repair photolyase